MEKHSYQQYQLTLHSDDLIADDLLELAHRMGLSFDDEDYDNYWLHRDHDYAYLIRNPEKDPNVFLIVLLRKEWEFDQLVIRCRRIDGEKVKDFIRRLYQNGLASGQYAKGHMEPDSSNILNSDKRDWVPDLVKRFNLDLGDITRTENCD